MADCLDLFPVPSLADAIHDAAAELAGFLRHVLGKLKVGYVFVGHVTHPMGTVTFSQVTLDIA